MTARSTRDQIVDAADRLFYENGFDHTSFADIAGAVKLSRGNFYYHFRTKDEILAAVIARRLDETAQMLEAWEKDGATPRARIAAFIDMMVMNGAKIERHGCPVGTLCTELAKLDHASRADARRLFTLFRDWLSRQFSALGRVADADVLATHLLVMSQGISTLAAAFNDGGLIRSEVAALHEWLDTVEPA
jgi:AcrR family transcriptional regulator